MRKGHWTLMQWHPLECRFYPKPSMDVLPLPAISRKRIPSINKLLERSQVWQVDRFMKHYRNGELDEAKDWLENFSDSVDISVIDECSALLSSNKHKLGPQTRHRLLKYGLNGNKTTNLIPNVYGSVSSPLKLLENGSAYSNQEIQVLLDSSNSLSPELREMVNIWTKQLMSVPDLENKLLMALGNEFRHQFLTHLSLEKQVNVVSTFMAQFTASAVSSTFPQSLLYVCKLLGNKIESELLSCVACKTNTPLYHAKSAILWNEIEQIPWNSKQKLIIGSFWINLALESCRFSMLYNGHVLSRPAFWHTWYMNGSTKKGILVANHSFISMLKEKKNTDLFITNNQIPPLVPPPPWVSTQPLNRSLYDRGARLISSQCTEGQATVDESIRNGGSLPQLAGLNRLQSQPWRINQAILSVLKVAGPTIKDNSAKLNSADKKERLRAQRAEKVTQTQWHQALRIAEALGERKFYLPMYMDFRGRCYPMANSSLSFMGKDTFRSLFLFGEHKELGVDGLMWLKIHLANLYGECKLKSFDERQEWVDSHSKDILDSAKDPLNCTWWKKASKPYQTLAACMELGSALASGDPKAYKSSLPIQLDGTSNGLQHLTALSRDAKNAAEVNIIGDSLGDVYNKVAEVASTSGLKLSRGNVKKAVMIYFYGGSQLRISESLKSEGIEASHLLSKVVTSTLDTMFKSARGVQLWLNECVKRLMSASRVDYINTDEAGAKSHGSPTVVWTTPLGLPVVQPYVNTKMMAVRTPLQSFYWPSPFHLPLTEKPKQVAGVAANFVHSLDAAHMLLTAQNMPPGTSFSAIHDSFWTHAATVPILNNVLRTQFAALYSENLLERVWNEWKQRYKYFMCLATVYEDSAYYTPSNKADDLEKYDLPPIKNVKWTLEGPQIGTPSKVFCKKWIPLEFPPPPPVGTLDISEVKKSTYFFS